MAAAAQSADARRRSGGVESDLARGLRRHGASGDLANRSLDRLSVMDLGPQDLQAFAHKGREARPALGGYEIAVDAGAGRLDVDVGPAGEPHLRFAILQGRDSLSFHDAIDGYEHLHAVANREDGLTGLVEVADDILNARVNADIFRPASSRIPRALPARRSC